MTRYPLAEKFVAPQGEGLYAGTVMAFVRFVGCSVGQKVCTSCDTDFASTHEELGGGLFSVEQLARWVGDTKAKHVCLTGGEPLDRDLSELVLELNGKVEVHVETSGTKRPEWLSRVSPHWICVSPKPGYRQDMIDRADEVKVILGGLGNGPGWPTLGEALAWARSGKLVYVQPRNGIKAVDMPNLQEAIQVVTMYPELRLSVQMHKFLGVR